MIKFIDIENFKAFGRSARIEMAPITLIYGQNSAGKSSVLNILNLLKQTLDSGDRTVAMLPRSNIGLVDFGSFREIVHNHDTSRNIRFRIEFDLRDSQVQRSYLPRSLRDHSSGGIGISFARHPDTSDVNIPAIEVFLGGSKRPAFKFEHDPHQSVSDFGKNIRGGLDMLPHLNDDREIRRAVTLLKCSDISLDASLWKEGYQRTLKFRTQIVDALEGLIEQSEGRTMSPIMADVLNAEVLEDARLFYSQEFSLEQYQKRMIDAEFASFIALWGFIPFDDIAHISPSEAVRRQLPELLVHRRLARRGSAPWTPDASRSAVAVGQLMELALRNLVPLGPYRRAPERLYIFSGTTPRDVGYAGHLLPDLMFSDESLMDSLNKWMGRLQLGYTISIERLGDKLNDVYEVRLKDSIAKSNVSVALPDVGFGISQLLPIIVQTLAAERKILTVEQPELHIHPALQADIGDLLISGIRNPYSHQFVVETHSEHLVLRLLRRIRETFTGELEDESLALYPKDVSVLYVSRGADGAEVHRLRISEDGDFIDAWPNGFFEERAKELF